MTTILVADDISENRYLLTSLLEGHGFAVTTATNGAEALASAREAPPDLIVSDILMPVMDGFELCRHWKRDERLKHVPFMFYTATYTDAKDESFAMSLGAERFLVKPLKPDLFVQAVREVLDRGAGGSGSPGDESELLRLHNEALLRKLEHKVAQLEAEVAQRGQVEASLRESERTFRLLAENSLDVVWSMGFDGRFTYVSPSVEKLRGYRPDEVMEQPLEEAFVPEALARFQEERGLIMDDLGAGRNPDRVGLLELEQPRKDGSTVWAETSIGVMRDDMGKAIGLLGVSRDITRRRQVEDELRRSQSQFLQSQKMESIGLLAGGVAHDFNNLLAVILGYVELAHEQLREGDPLRSDLQRIRDAADRAATLTRQLLAFAHRQLLAPEVLCLNQVVSGMEGMLRRVLDEDIAVKVQTADDLGSVVADPGQLEQVLMNLAVNARDAMPDGGSLTLETANVDLEDGDRYVRLTVTDSGTGMDEATRERIFEPFFTTKEEGKGTGLGLSTVYGIVKQSGGRIQVYSEPGRGTTFEILLPRVDAAVIEPRKPPADVLATGSETVLLVEDDEAVRRMAERILQRAGYRVRAASNGGEALLICEKSGDEIDVLLTDVKMPQMSGRELADRLAVLCPGLRTLYMSGYPDGEIKQDRRTGPRVRFLAKPFSAAALTRSLRETLDEV